MLAQQLRSFLEHLRWPGTSRLSIQSRLLWLTVLISASVLFISDNLTMLSSIRIVERDLGEQNAATAEWLAAELTRLPERGFQTGFESAVRRVFEIEPSVVRVDVYADYGEDLRLLVSSSSSGDRPLEGKEIAAYYNGKADTFTLDEGSGRRIFSIFPIRFSNGRQGFLTVVNSLRTVDKILAAHSQIRVLSLLIGTTLLVAGVVFLFRILVYRSMRHLIRIMRRFKDGDHDARSDENLAGEFSDLARNFNVLLSGIQTLNERMEEQVRHATSELAERNQALHELNLQFFDLQKRLAQSERLALVGQLTATFAHEIGSPLSAVSTHLQLLLEDSALTSRTRDRLRLAGEEIDRVCGIVEGLLDRTRSATKAEELDLAEIVHRVTRLLGPTLESRSVSLELSQQAGPFLLPANANELQQLFLNLFNNALDAMPHGGTLRIAILWEDSTTRDARPEIRVDVADTGVGIDSAKLSQIFEPFFTTKEFGRGTGLGLAVCREIARRHGGRLTATSTEGQGSCFTLCLPGYRSPHSLALTTGGSRP